MLLPQVCGSVSRSEEEELCKKQLELVVAKLSQPAVAPGTMADCMVGGYLSSALIPAVHQSNY